MDRPNPTTRAQQLAGQNFREATAEAKLWLSDCWTRLPDGRLTKTLGTAEVWSIVARIYDGGGTDPIAAFMSDARFTS